MTRRSRRSVLAACGAGVAALAGCSVDVSLDGDEEREYDPAALSRLADEGVPTRPDAFPVGIPDGMIERHYDRARERLAAVPEQVSVPNGVIAKRIRDERERAVERLEDRDDASTGLGRLGDARYARGEAAEVDGAYRAAVGEIDREAVAERRSTLRTDRLEFEAEWEYRGDDPARALVVHAELERLVERVRRDAETWPPFPADPRADVFRVGSIVGEVERGEATLDDATRLRTRYVDGTGTRSHRATITAASHRLERRAEWAGRRLHEFLDRRAPEAFERSVEGTPAAELYREARQRARGLRDTVRDAQRSGDHATATLRAGAELAALRTFDAVVDAVEAGEYGPPEDVGRIAAAREDAVGALRDAWRTDPAPVSVELSWPAHDTFREMEYYLDGSDGGSRSVHDAYASIAYAGLYAERVPSAVAAVRDALEVTG